MLKVKKRPKLLVPAGSYEALCAAISAGADEVYFGASGFNARAGAKNFTEGEFEEAIKLCRIFGVSSNITVNTLLFDREINEVLELVYKAACFGADAFIVQDIGLAQIIKREMPEVTLHASTQCACHNKDGAVRLYDAGFSRIVLARELSEEDIIKITDNAPYETEIFVHGALCVSHSGQCLFSSVVGGRSGNRGECAQPCRMEYTMRTCAGERKGYPLSLKDLSLAEHIDKICRSGAASLKIEGRMKSPEYVWGVTKIIKRLLEEERGANSDEMRQLRELFSRGGFTDSYYTRRYLATSEGMYGIRGKAEKEATKEAENSINIIQPRRHIKAECGFESGKKPYIIYSCGEYEGFAEGEEELESAKNSSATFESIAKNLVKLGSTPFILDIKDISMTVGESVFVPSGIINELRRKASQLLYEKMTLPVGIKRMRIGFCPQRQNSSKKKVKIRLYFESSENFKSKISGYNDIESIVFPLYKFASEGETIKKLSSDFRIGVLFPRVLFNGEKKGALSMLEYAKSCGASFCEVSNIGHIETARQAGLEIYGGIGLNITNSLSMEYYTEELGLSSIVLSPELKLGALRDIVKPSGVISCFYARGRLPLMVLESCIVKSCGICRKDRENEKVCGVITDRINASFPIYPVRRFDIDYPCRNIIYNSVITDLRSKKELYMSGIDVLCVSAEEDGMPL